MATRYLLDSNLLVYAVDRREPAKRERAREVLRRVGGAGSVALPAQVLSEFANACLRKLEPRPDPATVRREVERLLLAFPVFSTAVAACPVGKWGRRLLTAPTAKANGFSGHACGKSPLRCIPKAPSEPESVKSLKAASFRSECSNRRTRLVTSLESAAKFLPGDRTDYLPEPRKSSVIKSLTAHILLRH